MPDEQVYYVFRDGFDELWEMNPMNFLKWFQKNEKPGDTAKKRLQLVLVNTRVGLSPEIMERMKNDVLRVISKYVEVDADMSKFDWERSDDTMALVSSIEVKRVRRDSEMTH